MDAWGRAFLAPARTVVFLLKQWGDTEGTVSRDIPRGHGHTFGGIILVILGHLRGHEGRGRERTQIWYK